MSGSVSGPGCNSPGRLGQLSTAICGCPPHVRRLPCADYNPLARFNVVQAYPSPVFLCRPDWSLVKTECPFTFLCQRIEVATARLQQTSTYQLINGIEHAQPLIRLVPRCLEEDM